MGVFKKVIRAITRQHDNSFRMKAVEKQDQIELGEKILAPHYKTEEKYFKAAQDNIKVREEINRKREDTISNVNKFVIKSFDPPERPKSNRPLPTHDDPEAHMDEDYGFVDVALERIPKGKLKLRELMELLHTRAEIDFNPNAVAGAERSIKSHEAMKRIDGEKLEDLYDYYRPFTRSEKEYIVSMWDMDILHDYMTNKREERPDAPTLAEIQATPLIQHMRASISDAERVEMEKDRLEVQAGIGMAESQRLRMKLKEVDEWAAIEDADKARLVDEEEDAIKAAEDASFGRRVAVAVSGGVDSAVSAWLLKKRGYDVVGVFMINWDHRDESPEENACPRTSDQRDAEYVCDKLGIQMHVANFVKEYWNEIFERLIYGYETGRTPVPDIPCNRLIKFGLLHDFCRQRLDAPIVATGHYAQSSWGNWLERPTNEPPKLLRAVDTFKDQTYFLSTLSSDQLRNAMFPVGDMLKPDVKRLAVECGFEELAEKEESMGICFVGKKQNFPEFLEKYLTPRPGPIIDVDSGNVVGEHRGIHGYTIGKRIQLENGVLSQHEGIFVAKFDVNTNTVYVCIGSSHRCLFATAIHIQQPYWISGVPPSSLKNLQMRTQRTHAVIHCDVIPNADSSAILKPRLPIRAAAPGQVCVFYDKNVCLGAAEIIGPHTTL